MFARSIETVFIMLTLILIGWIISYKGWLNADSKRFLNKLIVKIAIPASIISNFFTSFPKEMLSSSAWLVGIPILNMVFLFFISKFLIKVFKISTNRAGTFIAMCVVSNCMFFGFPIALSLFGDASIPFVMFYYIANSIMFWGFLSPIMIGADKDKKTSLLKTSKRFLSIPFVTVLICCVLLYLNYSPPTFIMKLSNQISGIVTPLASIFVGRIIYEIDFREFKFDRSVLLVIFMRFLVAPALMILVTRFFNLPMLIGQVYTIQAAMPVMLQTTLISELHGKDSRYAATVLSTTTILSLLFIPIYILILTM